MDSIVLLELHLTVRLATVQNCKQCFSMGSTMIKTVFRAFETHIVEIRMFNYWSKSQSSYSKHETTLFPAKYKGFIELAKCNINGNSNNYLNHKPRIHSQHT